MRHTLKNIAVIALSVLLVPGCAMLGPDYQQPDAPVGTDWLETGVPRISSEPLIDPRWWENAFRDPELDRLIEMALEENLSLLQRSFEAGKTGWTEVLVFRREFIDGRRAYIESLVDAWLAGVELDLASGRAPATGTGTTP